VTSAEDKKWLTERFKNMLADILKESWVYQEIAEEGREEGRAEELRNMLTHLTSLRFPNLVSQAQKQAEQTKSQEQLRTMIDKLFTATTEQEARDAFIG